MLLQNCLDFAKNFDYTLSMDRKIFIPRDIGPLLEKLVKQFPSLAVTGPRQSGKSTLLKKLFKTTHQYVSFDEPLIRQKAITDPKLFFSEFQKPVILDEIQYVPELLSYIKIFIDDDRSANGRFILTGSQQFNLIKNLGDSLAGRIGLLTLLGFSKHEKERFNALKKKALSPEGYFIDACLRGTFPEMSVNPKISFEAWYGSYLQTYLERDVRAIYNIGNLREFQKFLQLLATRCSQMLNLNSLSGELGISVNTIKRWISVLEASGLVYLLMPYYRNLGKRITKNPKVYFLDCGLVCYLTGISERKHLLNGPMAGQLFENYIIQETVKSFFNRGKRANIFYLRTHNDVEVDLIIEKNMKIFPFEIKITKTPDANMAKPIAKFKSIFSKFDIKKGNIISFCDKDSILTSDVSCISIDTYLNWLNKHNV